MEFNVAKIEQTTRFSEIANGTLFAFPLIPEDGDTEYGLYLKIDETTVITIVPTSSDTPVYGVGEQFNVTGSSTIVLPVKKVEIKV